MIVKGYCKECGNEVKDTDIIPGYNLYECEKCGYPNAEEDLWDEISQYLSYEIAEEV